MSELNVARHTQVIAEVYDDVTDSDLLVLWTPQDRLLAAACSYVADNLPVPVDLLASLAEHGVELSAVIEEGKALQELITEIEGEL